MCYCNPLLEKKKYFSCKHLLTDAFLCHFVLEYRVSWERQETQRKCSEKNWRGQWITAHEVVIFKEIWLLHQFKSRKVSRHVLFSHCLQKSYSGLTIRHVIKIVSHHCHHQLLILGVQMVAGHQYETACREIDIVRIVSLVGKS